MTIIATLPDGTSIRKGLSTDTKPNAELGSLYYETDTKILKKKTGAASTDWDAYMIGGAQVMEPNKMAQEQGPGETGEYGVGVDDAEYSILTGSANIGDGQPVRLYLITVVAATSGANDINIRDAVAAGVGTIIETIPSGSAKGSTFIFKGDRLRTGLYVDYGAAGAGTLRVNWLPILDVV